jgi:TatD DNase family protein
MGIAVEADKSRVRTLAVTTTPRAWPREREMFGQLQFVRIALGIHPELAAERASEVTLWEQYLDETRYVGEVGLDGRPQGRATLPEQRKVFQRILEICAERGGKVLTVHSAGIAVETVNMIVKHLPPDRGHVVLHWFVGSKAATELAVAHGCYFSINATMLRSEAARKTIAVIPRDRLLTETDGPFTDLGGRTAKPSDMPNTVAQVAEHLRTSWHQLREQISSNLKALLR